MTLPRRGRAGRGGWLSSAEPVGDQTDTGALLFFASAVGGVAGVLTHLAGDSLPAAALAAGAAFAASTATFHNLVGRS